MKKLFILLMSFIIIMTFIGCGTAPKNNSTVEAKIYWHINETAEYTDYEAISLSLQSGGVIYSVDRDNRLMVMEIGRYTVNDGVIIISAGKFQATGTITDDSIIIDNKVYSLMEK